MHVFLYEWITAGGLIEESGRLPTSLVAEGSAMISALAADFARIDGCRVSAVRDIRLDEPVLPNCDVTEIHSASHLEEASAELASAADNALIIAPEFDDILSHTVRRLRRRSATRCGATLLNAPDEFITCTANKQTAADRLAAAGVPVPESTLIEADQHRLPPDFTYPAVLKPLDGAGSLHTLLVHGPRDEPDPHPWPRRLERFCPGRAASVAFLCGPSGNFFSLPPCWQRLSDDGRFTYLGGATIAEPPLANRATMLAEQALAALPPAHGYVGVDLVLDNAVAGSQDVVIEVNPRVTTSYVGLRAALKNNLAELMWKVASGDAVDVTQTNAPVEFTAAGAVWQSSS